jgi:hypothetical protein
MIADFDFSQGANAVVSNELREALSSKFAIKPKIAHM